MTKKCRKCGAELPVASFGTDRRNPDGLNRWCRTCINEVNTENRARHPERARAASKAWRQRHPEKSRAQGRVSRVRRYGLAEADYRSHLEEQGGGCAVCREKAGMRALHIDHLHVEGYAAMPYEERRRYFRGLLCANCNRGLGHAEDDLVLLESAAVYLEAFEWSRRSKSSKR